MGWLIALAAIGILSVIPLGFRAVYRDKQPGVWLIIGPMLLRVYPTKPKKNVQQKSPKQSVPKKQKKSEAKSVRGGSYRDFLPIVHAIFDFLGHFRRKIRISHLEMKLILAGDDPCDLSVNYGKAWAALGNLMPQLERLFVIKKRDLEVKCDFTASETLIFVRLDATITLGRTLYLLSWHGIKVLKQLLILKKLRKGGTNL